MAAVEVGAAPQPGYRSQAQPATARAPRRLVGQLVVIATVVAVTVELLRVHGGVAGTELASSWQLLDLRILEDDPLRGVWYLHTQPPLHNLLVGLVAWSPLPTAGTMFALYIGCLAVLGLLVHDLLLRWHVPIVAATVVASLAVVNPALLSTIRIVSYEVPLATMLVAAIWLLDRYLDRPTARRLGLVVALIVAMVLTRSLFHPLWLAVVLLIVLTARPVPRRQVLVAVAVPLVAVGGWTLKNAVMFDSATLSSWTGFNLHRGVLDPMDAAAVDEAIAAGDVSGLAGQRPWQELDVYRPWLAGCRSAGGHPAISEESKSVGAFQVANFNHECYLGLYRQSRADAVTMIRRQPGQYLSDRGLAVVMSHAYTPLGLDDPAVSLLGEPLPSRSWMDRLYSILMVRQQVDVDTRDWNVPLYGDGLRFAVAWPLVLGTLLVVVRTPIAMVRCWRARRDRRLPDAFEVIWLVAGTTIACVIFGGDLVELGENGRFRAMLDPLVLALATATTVHVVRHLPSRRASTTVNAT